MISPELTPWRTCGLSFGPFGATAPWRGFQVGAARVLVGLDDDLWCKTQFVGRVKPDSLEVKHGKTQLLWGKHTYFHEVKHNFYWVQHNFYGNLSRKMGFYPRIDRKNDRWTHFLAASWRVYLSIHPLVTKITGGYLSSCCLYIPVFVSHCTSID
jgi:hypothetical protein